jgi:Calcineurin-like phosphoesterase
MRDVVPSAGRSALSERFGAGQYAGPLGLITPPDTDPALSPDSPSQRQTLPVARRFAGRGTAFPLLWHPRGAGTERLPMVGWFDPGPLLVTGAETLAALVVGERSDPRLVQAIAARETTFYDYTIHYKDDARGPCADDERTREEIWIDYVCDTGDGWNPVYAVAYTATQPVLELAGETGRRYTTARGDLLVFGGDQVYPTPSRQQYQRRLITPYESAFGEADPDEAPHVFAIPGNHDWYDGLSAFSRLFCSAIGGRWFAGWATRQNRSYFALKLPGHWWLLGSDGQLRSDLDTPQIEYFRDIAAHHMRPGDRVILVMAVPVWIYAHKYRQLDQLFDETDLIYLREEVLAPRGVEVKVLLSGDLHHYRRHEEVGPPPGKTPVQKITAGGGGAFLHATHDEDVARIVEEATRPGSPPRIFGLKTAYPDLRRSWRLSFGNLLFPLKNPNFGIVPALLYLITAWIVAATIGFKEATGALDALRLTGLAVILQPGAALWMLGVAALFLAFTDTHSKTYRVAAGLTHAATHWACIFYVGWGAIVISGWLLPDRGFLRLILSGALVFAGGWIIGSFVMGLYLLISLNVFGRHGDQAFAALKIEDFKNFLRLHIARDGTLTIYPVKIERVPRRWRDRVAGDSTPSRVVPDEPLHAALIEPPIVIPPRS